MVFATSWLTLAHWSSLKRMNWSWVFRKIGRLKCGGSKGVCHNASHYSFVLETLTNFSLLEFDELCTVMVPTI
jgi:hypothetical protein